MPQNSSWRRLVARPRARFISGKGPLRPRLEDKPTFQPPSRNVVFETEESNISANDDRACPAGNCFNTIKDAGVGPGIAPNYLNESLDRLRPAENLEMLFASSCAHFPAGEIPAGLAAALPDPLRPALGAFRRRCRRRLLTIQPRRPISEALICNARYFEYIRHWAKLPAINQRPG